jgi:hypothetical protein
MPNPDLPKGLSEAEHEVRRDDDGRMYTLMCHGVPFATLYLVDPSLSSPDLGVVQSFMESTMRAHTEVVHGG